MSEQTDSNKRIARNTLTLYFRMLFLMCISLYTSRVVLEALGVVDYGIYNVVGGFVSMFSLISATLTSASSRFINYEMGKGQTDRLNTVFSTSLNVHIILAVIIALLCESVGLWYLNNKMVIPSDRLYAANWVFQISILNFCISLITVPFTASIIAHEKMSTFAYVSIFEGIARLLICFAVLYSSFDHLILYALLYMMVQVSVTTMYRLYCRRHFDECHYRWIIDRELIRHMFNYAGWHLFGNSAAILNRQGVDLVLNFFCGPVLNAAKGISNQVNNVVTNFVGNFMMAVNPQITQSYSRGNFSYMFSLVFRGSRFSYYLLLLLAFPVILNADGIIHLWLTEVPDYAVIFAQLAMMSSMISSFSNTLMTAQNATGKVRNYQIVVGGIQLMNLPFCFLVLYLGASPLSVLVVAICVEILSLIARLFMIPLTIKEFSPWMFVKEVLLNALLVTIIAIPIPLAIHILYGGTIVSLCIETILCVICSSASILFWGCKLSERQKILHQAESMVGRRIKKK